MSTTLENNPETSLPPVTPAPSASAAPFAPPAPSAPALRPTLSAAHSAPKVNLPPPPPSAAPGMVKPAFRPAVAVAPPPSVGLPPPPPSAGAAPVPYAAAAPTLSSFSTRDFSGVETRKEKAGLVVLDFLTLAASLALAALTWHNYLILIAKPLFD